MRLTLNLSEDIEQILTDEKIWKHVDGRDVKLDISEFPAEVELILSGGIKCTLTLTLPREDSSDEHLLSEEAIGVLKQIHEAVQEVIPLGSKSPFLQNGDGFKCRDFRVEPFDKDKYQEYNFKWRNVEILWYKHFRKSAVSNVELSARNLVAMRDECLKAIEEYKTGKK